MKKYLLIFVALCTFLLIPQAHAYVVVRTDISGNFNPTTNSTLNEISINDYFTPLSYPTLGNNVFITDFAQFWSIGGANGTYINVIADYYVLISTPFPYSNFSQNSRFTLTASNLRCGYGAFMANYNTSAGLPEVSNFSVTYTYGSAGMATNHLYRVKFAYKQRVPQINETNTNISCWFNVDGGNLVGQLVGSGLTNNVGVAYRTNSLQYSVSNDPNTAILQGLQDEQKKTTDAVKDNTQATKDQTDTMKDPSIDLSDGNSFFSGFKTDTYGLTSIITAPLTLIGSITNGTCTPLGLPLPYVNQTAELPCMSTIYQRYFGSFYSVYHMITFGLVSYWISIKIFNMVKDFKNPDHDEVEVFDL